MALWPVNSFTEETDLAAGKWKAAINGRDREVFFQMTRLLLSVGERKLCLLDRTVNYLFFVKILPC